MAYKSWSTAGKKSDSRYMLSFVDQIALNTLCPIYHSGLGYDQEERWESNDEDRYLIKLDIFPGLIKKHFMADGQNVAIMDIDKAKECASAYKLRHKTIIVRARPCGQSQWLNHTTNEINKPAVLKADLRSDQADEALDWYELPAGDGYVGPLSERPYIHITDRYDEIEIRSSEKKHRITIDDVLFACRGLCYDDTRVVGRFNILSDDGSTLVLMANIDNWST